MEAFEEFVKKVVSSYEKFSHEAAELQVKLVELYKEVLSRFTESYEKMLEPVMGFLHQLCDYACSLAEHLVDCLKAHEGEISQLLVGVSTYIQGMSPISILPLSIIFVMVHDNSLFIILLTEFSQFCVNTIEQLRHETHDFVKVIVDQLKTLPIYTSFEEKYKELTNVELPQTLKNFYSEITFAAEDIMKTPELKDFTENLLGYLFKVTYYKFESFFWSSIVAVLFCNAFSTLISVPSFILLGEIAEGWTFQRIYFHSLLESFNRIANSV